MNIPQMKLRETRILRDANYGGGSIGVNNSK